MGKLEGRIYTGCILLGKVGSLLGLWKDIYRVYIIGKDRVVTWALEGYIQGVYYWER